MDPQVIYDDLNHIYLSLVALAFFDCLFILAVGLSAAWTVSLLNKDQQSRVQLLEERYRRDRAEFDLLVQMVRKLSDAQSQQQKELSDVQNAIDN